MTNDAVLRELVTEMHGEEEYARYKARLATKNGHDNTAADHTKRADKIKQRYDALSVLLREREWRPIDENMPKDIPYPVLFAWYPNITGLAKCEDGLWHVPVEDECDSIWRQIATPDLFLFVPELPNGEQGGGKTLVSGQSEPDGDTGLTPCSSASVNKPSHAQRTIRVLVDVDEGIADTVLYLNTIPGVRTHASCQGTIGEGGPNPYRPQVMVTWTDAKTFARLQREFDLSNVSPTGSWCYVHPRDDHENCESPAMDAERREVTRT